MCADLFSLLSVSSLLCVLLCGGGAVCSVMIKGEELQWSHGHPYHRACFTCCEPNCSSSSSSTTALPALQPAPTDARRLYCSAHYLAKFARCTACHLSLSGAVLKAAGGQYHRKCFGCSVCHVSLVGVPVFALKAPAPPTTSSTAQAQAPRPPVLYCKEHYAAAKQQLAAAPAPAPAVPRAAVPPPAILSSS